MSLTETPESADAAIAHMCGIVETMMQSGDRSAGALASMESACKALGLLCSTSCASESGCASGFAMQYRALAWIHGAVNTDQADAP